MEKCYVLGCRHYHGQYVKTLCRWHQIKYGISAIITEEMRKHIRVGIPIHDRRTNQLKY